MKSRISLLVIALGSIASNVLAQGSAGPAALVVLPGVQSDGPRLAESPSFGVASTSVVSYAAHAFVPIDSVQEHRYTVAGGNLALYHYGSEGYYLAPVNLPTGSLIQSVEFRFCDTDPGSFESFLNINDKTGGILQPALVVSTDPEEPGCINRSFTPDAPIQIDNDRNAYSLEVLLDPDQFVNEILLLQARIYYSLQVSPPPAVATFPNDVPPNHPFFQFVEALAAAGITVGIGPETYGVNNPVTRGQMAVFLAKALGLHFPN
jgi:hypothetical protein